MATWTGERAKAYHAAWRERNRAKINERQRTQRSLNRTSHNEQANASKMIGGICLDHCHTRSVFRGWLCRHCNWALGALGDNAWSLKKVVRYLEASGDPT